MNLVYFVKKMQNTISFSKKRSKMLKIDKLCEKIQKAINFMTKTY